MAALAASVLVALLGIGVVLAVQTRANGRLQQANSALEKANGRVTEANAELKLANTREKQRFNLAMEAIKVFHGEVSDDVLMKEKQFDGLRKKLLKGEADFYGKLEDLVKGQTDRESAHCAGKGAAPGGRDGLSQCGSLPHRDGPAPASGPGRLPASAARPGFSQGSTGARPLMLTASGGPCGRPRGDCVLGDAMGRRAHLRCERTRERDHRLCFPIRNANLRISGRPNK